jgi:hypothetical protein
MKAFKAFPTSPRLLQRCQHCSQKRRSSALNDGLLDASAAVLAAKAALFFLAPQSVLSARRDCPEIAASISCASTKAFGARCLALPPGADSAALAAPLEALLQHPSDSLGRAATATLVASAPLALLAPSLEPGAHPLAAKGVVVASEKAGCRPVPLLGRVPIRRHGAHQYHDSSLPAS